MCRRIDLVVFVLALALVLAQNQLIEQQCPVGEDHGELVYRSPSLIVVSQGKDGDFSKVQDAIDHVPSNNTDLITILVKPGFYREKVTIPAEKPNITLSGYDTMKTIITWNDSINETENLDTSATVIVYASDFEARFITIENSYKGGNVPAVAITISGDRSAFYNCRFIGFQDTVYDKEGRHYFNNCFIQGSVDFICGNGQSIYEKCNLNAKTWPNGALTAQSRNTSEEGTGFVFLNCNVTGGPKMLLGRAWGIYSRVIFAYTYMADIILPQGWYNWSDPAREKTVTFGQYQCSGPGSNTAGRVPWSHELSDEEAAPFLNISFIDGEQWIKKRPY